MSLQLNGIELVPIIAEHGAHLLTGGLTLERLESLRRWGDLSLQEQKAVSLAVLNTAEHMPANSMRDVLQLINSQYKTALAKERTEDASYYLYFTGVMLGHNFSIVKGVAPCGGKIWAAGERRREDRSCSAR